MDLNDYQSLALRTAANKTVEDDDKRLLLWTVAWAGEVGEFCNMLKKKVGHGHDFTEEQLGDEIGDVLWYLAVIADELGLSLDQIAEQNIEKLKRRYPEGFSQEASINRTE